MPTCMVTMDPIDVDCHNQLIGHLPACSRSGGHAFDLAADCQQPLSLPTAGMVGHYLRVTPGFFCCQRVYSVVKRDLSQCCGSATRAPHWQFLLENRDEKSSGSGSQNQGKLTFLAPWGLYAKLWLETCSPPYHIYGGH